jgi:hypothetical protein
METQPEQFKSCEDAVKTATPEPQRLRYVRTFQKGSKELTKTPNLRRKTPTIRELYSKGYGVCELARLFKVTPGNICAIADFRRCGLEWHPDLFGRGAM